MPKINQICLNRKVLVLAFELIAQIVLQKYLRMLNIFHCMVDVLEFQTLLFFS